ncbi:WD repeat-containing protein 6 [Chytridiales sp. JEL 0842]|nr:WD repeat-containing protein 6 [Chytridiales sp. JEL 0842]
MANIHLHPNQQEPTTTFSLGPLVETKSYIQDATFIPSLTGVGVVLAHNIVELYTIKDEESLETTRFVKRAELWGADTSILYSAKFFWGDKEDPKKQSYQKEEGEKVLKVAVGTAYGDILIFEVPPKHRSEVFEKRGILVSSRLSGHRGAIFRVRLDSTQTRLASCADDRMIRIWNLTDPSTKPIILIGHNSRIWDCQFTPNTIGNDWVVSVSEDCTCRVWNLESGSCVQVWKGHEGKSVWALDLHPNGNVVATGGNEGSVALWSLKEVVGRYGDGSTNEKETPFPTQNLDLSSKPDRPKQLVSNPLDSTVFITTEQGRLYKFHPSNPSKSTWIVKQPLTDNNGKTLLMGDVVMNTSSCGSVLAVGGLDGHIFVSSNSACETGEKDWATVGLWKAHEDGRSDFVYTWKDHPQNEVVHVVSVSQKAAEAIHFTFRATTNTLSHPVTFARFSLSTLQTSDPATTSQKKGKAGVVSTIAKHPHLPFLLFGFRDGSWSLYKIPSSPTTLLTPPFVSKPNAHGKCQVTSASWILSPSPNPDTDFKLVTSGRDGSVAFWNVSFQGEIQETHRVFLTKGWIEDVEVTASPWGKRHITAYGFFDSKFRVWDVLSGQEQYAVPIVGGGHKRWAFARSHNEQQQEEGGGWVVYIRLDKVWVVALSQHSKEGEDEFSVKSGGGVKVIEGMHGLETRVVKVVDCGDGQLGLATTRKRPHSPIPTNGLNRTLLIASGGEDTKIKFSLLRLPASNPRIRPILSIKKHRSGVKGLQLVPWNFDSSTRRRHSKEWRMFSCGASEDMRCWRVVLNLEDKQGDRISCVELAQAPEVSQVTEPRLMDLCVTSPSIPTDDNNAISCTVATACSDGHVRFWSYKESHSPSSSSTFTLITDSDFHTGNCVLKVVSLETTFPPQKKSEERQILFVSADTAGRIAFWECRRLGSKNNVKWLGSFVGHKGGVNALDAAFLFSRAETTTMVVSTGGEDNAVGVWVVSLAAGSPLKVEARDKVESLHSSTVTGVQLLKTRATSMEDDDMKKNRLLWRMASSCVDHLFQMWDVEIEFQQELVVGSVKLKPGGGRDSKRTLDVSDASDMDILEVEEGDGTGNGGTGTLHLHTLPPLPTDGDPTQAPSHSDPSWIPASQHSIRTYLASLSAFTVQLIQSFPSLKPLLLRRTDGVAHIEFHSDALLCGLPEGYRLFSKQRRSDEVSDVYMFGHPKGTMFRSTKEFIPHLQWLLLSCIGEQSTCFCIYCSGHSPVRAPRLSTSSLNDRYYSSEDKETVIASRQLPLRPSTLPDINRRAIKGDCAGSETLGEKRSWNEEDEEWNQTGGYHTKRRRWESYDALSSTPRRRFSRSSSYDSCTDSTYDSDTSYDSHCRRSRYGSSFTRNRSRSTSCDSRSDYTYDSDTSCDSRSAGRRSRSISCESCSDSIHSESTYDSDTSYDFHSRRSRYDSRSTRRRSRSTSYDSHSRRSRYNSRSTRRRSRSTSYDSSSDSISYDSRSDSTYDSDTSYGRNDRPHRPSTKHRSILTNKPTKSSQVALLESAPNWARFRTLPETEKAFWRCKFEDFPPIFWDSFPYCRFLAPKHIRDAGWKERHERGAGEKMLEALVEYAPDLDGYRKMTRRQQERWRFRFKDVKDFKFWMRHGDLQHLAPRLFMETPAGEDRDPATVLLNSAPDARTFAKVLSKEQKNKWLDLGRLLADDLKFWDRHPNLKHLAPTRIQRLYASRNKRRADNLKALCKAPSYDAFKTLPRDRQEYWIGLARDQQSLEFWRSRSELCYLAPDEIRRQLKKNLNGGMDVRPGEEWGPRLSRLPTTTCESDDQSLSPPRHIIRPLDPLSRKPLHLNSTVLLASSTYLPTPSSSRMNSEESEIEKQTKRSVAESNLSMSVSTSSHSVASSDGSPMESNGPQVSSLGVETYLKQFSGCWTLRDATKTDTVFSQNETEWVKPVPTAQKDFNLSFFLDATEPISETRHVPSFLDGATAAADIRSDSIISGMLEQLSTLPTLSHSTTTVVPSTPPPPASSLHPTPNFLSLSPSVAFPHVHRPTDLVCIPTILKPFGLVYWPCAIIEEQPKPHPQKLWSTPLLVNPNPSRWSLISIQPFLDQGREAGAESVYTLALLGAGSSFCIRVKEGDLIPLSKVNVGEAFLGYVKGCAEKREGGFEVPGDVGWRCFVKAWMEVEGQF